MPSSSHFRLLRRLLLLILLLGAVGGYAWWAKPWVEKPISITVDVVQPGPASEVLAVNGQIVPSEEVDLGAPVAGQVVEVLVDEGDQVEKGDVLARLDDTIARAALDQTEASLESARIDVQSTKAAFDRVQALNNNISAQERDRARFTFKAAQARVRQLSAALDQARQQLSLYRIVAPIKGTVLQVGAELGQVVGSSSVIFKLGDLSAPLVETDVDEIYGALLKKGLAARVAPVGSRTGMAAAISFVAPTVNRDTGGRTIQLSFDTPPTDMLPSGLTMSVNVVVNSFATAITVPRAAIHDLDSAPFVMLDDGGNARAQPISIRDWPSDRLVVSAGLKAGDRVITDPQDVPEGASVSAGAEN